VNPNTLHELLKRAKLLTERADPTVKKSNTLKLLPSRVTPYAERALPMRTQLRTDSEEPKHPKSNNETQLAILTRP
jgi:hypothetical protein